MSEAELKEYRIQLESVEAALKDDPGNAELESLASELKEVISLTEAVIAETTGSASKTSASPYPSSTSTPIPVSSAASTEAGSSTHTYAVGDNVLARWTSGDNQLYLARITSITGSSKNPVYLVKFTQYNATEQLYPKDIKPTSGANKKRKLDSPVGPAASPAPNSAIISQPAAINAELAEARRDKAATAAAASGEKPAKKGRKLEQKKVLEHGQKKWQEFAAKGVKGKSGRTKKIGEGSMFRTPESVHGRVGFTGSGQPMRKDVARGKHIYQHGDDDE